MTHCLVRSSVSDCTIQKNNVQNPSRYFPRFDNRLKRYALHTLHSSLSTPASRYQQLQTYDKLGQLRHTKTLGRNFADFPRHDYSFHVKYSSVFAEHITATVTSGMELYIPHTFSQPKFPKPWFNKACSWALNDSVSRLKYESHALYISSICQTFIFNRKCMKL